LKSHYHLNGEGLGLQRTLTNQYFFNAIPWFMVILSLPVVIAVVIVIDKGRNLISLALLGGFGLLILINSTALIHRNTMRFFHPDEWIALIFLGVFFGRIPKRRFRQIQNREGGSR
jgi:cytochrome c biogenesis factor